MIMPDPFDIFDRLAGDAPRERTPPAPAPVIGEELSVRLQHNLSLAVHRQGELLSRPVYAEDDIKERRLVAEVANNVARLAASVNATALQARKDNFLARVLIVLAQEKQKLGYELGEEELKRLGEEELKRLGEAHDGCIERS
jgi:hypothetical protein